MDEFTTLFTAIGDFFTKSGWSQMVKWPFWILLSTIAAGGIYCARYGKKTLTNQGISCALSLIILYLISAILCIHVPSLRTMFGYLPFFEVTGESARLIDPTTLQMADGARELLELMILVVMLDGADALITGKNWLLWRCTSYAIALFFFTAAVVCIKTFLPAIFGRFAIVPVVLLIALGLVLIMAKFVFTSVISKAPSAYTKANKFFTGNKLGAIFTTSSLTFLLTMIVLGVLCASKCLTVTYATANIKGLCIILALLILTMWLFDTYFIDRKKS